MEKGVHYLYQSMTTFGKERKIEDEMGEDIDLSCAMNIPNL